MSEQELIRKYKALELENHLMTDFSKILNLTVGMDYLLEAIIGSVTDGVEAVSSTLYTVGNDSFIRFSYIYGVDEQTKEKLKAMRLKIGEGIVGSVVAHGKSEFIADAQKDERFYKESDKKTGFITKSIICVPLKVDGRVIGAIQVLNKKDDKIFTEEDLNLLNKMSDLAAAALNKERLYEKINYEKEFNEYIIENIAEGIFVVDNNFNIVSSNSMLSEMSGGEYSRELIAGQHVSTIFEYLDLEEIYKKVFTEGIAYEQSEDTQSSLLFKMIPRKNPEQEVTEVVTIIRYRK